VVRSTLDHATHKTQRVIDFAGLAEVRPDDAPGGIFLARLSVSNSTAVEEARSLATGERLAARSGYLHKDLRGSVVAQSTFEKKSAVELVAGTDYEPWGDKLGVGTLAAPVHAFLDREPDPGLGYYQLGARVYDPKLRRWISPDPLLLALPELDTGSAAQLNLYAYGLNNPVRYIDVGGTDGWDKVTGFVYGALEAVIPFASMVKPPSTEADFSAGRGGGLMVVGTVMQAHGLMSLATATAAGGKSGEVLVGSGMAAAIPAGAAAAAAAAVAVVAAGEAAQGTLAVVKGKDLRQSAAARKAAESPPAPKTAPPTNGGSLRSRMGEPPPGMKNPQAHHDLPKKFAERFKQAGLDPESPEHGRWVEGGKLGDHQRWSKEFNDAWERFFGQPGERTKEEILQLRDDLRSSGRFQ
jgi:RHS repeat-associated protein